MNRVSAQRTASEVLSKIEVIAEGQNLNSYVFAGFDQQCSSGLDHFLAVDRYGYVSHPCIIW